MRTLITALIFALLLFVVAAAQPPTDSPQKYTLTIQVDGVDKDPGNIGILVFNNDKGWAEDRASALRDISVPAHPGTVIITVADLPPGDYAVALIHDVNQNHKCDKNWIGKPKEQWGMSNNPHGTIKAPPFNKAKFVLARDTEIHVQLQ